MKEYGKQVKCPPWTLDATPAEEPLISAGVGRIYALTLRNAPKSVPNHGDIKTWHKILFERVVPLSYYAGNFRAMERQRPCLQYHVKVGGLLGEPPDTVNVRMIQFADDLRVNDFAVGNHLLVETRPYYQTLAKMGLVAWAMGRFIQIHPFANGNGRVARLLANYLCHRFELPMPFRHPSKRPLEDGYSDAGRAAMSGDFKPTFEYLLRLLEDMIGSY